MSRPYGEDGPEVIHIKKEYRTSSGRAHCGPHNAKDKHVIKKGTGYTRYVQKVDGELDWGTICTPHFYGYDEDV